MSKINSSSLMKAMLITPLTSAIFFSTSACGNEPEYKISDSVYFNPVFLNSGNTESIDLSRFEHGGSASPGVWPTAIYVNNDRISYNSVLFTEQSNKKVTPCITLDIIKKINFNYTELSGEFLDKLSNETECYPIDKLLPDTFVTYDSSNERLDISIPQSLLNNKERGYIDPSLWDHGIPAVLVGYNLSHYFSKIEGISSRSFYAGINAGINLDAWYFRHDGHYNWQEHTGKHYESINNFVQRDIPAIKGRIRIGETITEGILFDTLPFRGIELVSDDRMLPLSRRGYAPEVRGVARTNARVIVSQNGRIVYETTVSPGAFVINDLNATGYGGNLDVAINEADGGKQTFSVPYSSVAQLLRKGTHQYDLVAGKLNDPSVSHRFDLYQLTYLRGLTNYITGFGGIQKSDNSYTALQAGGSFSTPAGAFSVSAIHAKPHFKNTNISDNGGQSYQISYSKYIQNTDSNLTIAAYRYSTSGYFDFLSAMKTLDAESHGDSVVNIRRPKNRFNITMNQGLPGKFGQFYITGYTQNYWENNNSDLQYQLGYSNTLNRLSFSINAGRSRNIHGKMENNFYLNMSMPLADYSHSHIPMLNASINHNGNGRTGEQIGLSGSLGKEMQYNYGMTAANYNQGAGSSISVNGGWRSPYTHLTGSYSAGRHYQNQSLNTSGTLIGWSGGVVMTPYTGNTFAIVEAKDAQGAKVGGYPGIRIDAWGHAAVPYLNPYEMNEINIDPKGLPHSVELHNTTEKVAPYSGAVTKIDFKTQRGIPLLIKTIQENNQPVPFGADVLNESGQHVGNAGQNGQVFARVENNTGTLTVKWGKTKNQQCRFIYSIVANQTNEFNQINSICNK
ncbi:fimbria/pilus outer membrane usher protein [Morganella morganii]|uniref:fimbria/pilus outer membrane usher protein n=1 Tax=Morganella morganii TaxID=582 RepID=UPI002025AFCC|nr:fimbria/pilus outer membrane usher protein [Morganella morganii]